MKNAFYFIYKTFFVLEIFKLFYICLPSYLSYTLSQYLGGDWLTHRGKFQISKNFPGWDLAVNFSLGRNMKILRGESNKHTVLNKKTLTYNAFCDPGRKSERLEERKNIMTWLKHCVFFRLGVSSFFSLAVYIWYDTLWILFIQ